MQCSVFTRTLQYGLNLKTPTLHDMPNVKLKIKVKYSQTHTVYYIKYYLNSSLYQNRIVIVFFMAFVQIMSIATSLTFPDDPFLETFSSNLRVAVVTSKQLSKKVSKLVLKHGILQLTWQPSYYQKQFYTNYNKTYNHVCSQNDHIIFQIFPMDKHT